MATTLPERFGIKPHAIQRMTNRYFGLAGLLFFMGLVGAHFSVWAVPTMMWSGAAFFVWLGWHVRRSGAAVQVTNRAFHAVATGAFDDARRLHDYAEAQGLTSMPA